MTGTSASSHPAAVTCCAPPKCAGSPVPKPKPRPMSSSSAVTFVPARTFCSRRPGPTPRTCTAASIAITATATSACGVTATVTGPSAAETSGRRSAANGTNRPREAAKPTALAAIAPENPATNDVQPVKNAAAGPNASRRYTYSPPAFGRSAASSAYDIAPANASTPPASHAPIMRPGCGTSVATMAGVRKMPLPMTFETMMAAASSVPSRRSRSGGGAAGRGVAATSAGQELALDRELPQLRPRGGTVLPEDLDLEIDELGVLQHREP